MILLDIPIGAYNNAINVMFLMVFLIIIDTITKWLIIVHKYNKETERECTLWNTFRGLFFRAWRKGYLESRQFRENLGKKAEAYAVAILVAIAIYLFPDFEYSGIRIDETISMFIYLAIVLAEGFSIAENLRELGVSHIELFEKVLKAILSRFGINTEERKP